MDTMLSRYDETKSDADDDGDAIGYQKGQWVDARDTVNQWLEATILDSKECVLLNIITTHTPPIQKHT